jgi:hypothetical protein
MRKTRPSSSAEVLAFIAGVATFAAGCNAACDTSDDGNPPEVYAKGTAANGGYESSPWKSGLLPFPGGKQYQLEHHLGFTPSQVDVFIGFGPDGERVAPCAGNSCLVRCVDDRIVWIKNDTCSDFWVRVATAGRSFESGGATCTGGSIDAGPPDVTSDASAPDVAKDDAAAIDDASDAISNDTSLPD